MIPWEYWTVSSPIFPRPPSRNPGLIRLARIFRSGADALGSRRKFGNLTRTAWLIGGLGALLLTRGAGQAQSQRRSRADDHGHTAARGVATGLPDEVIILNNASDIGEFWKKLKQPDLILIKPGTRPSSPPAAADPGTTATARPRLRWSR